MINLTGTITVKTINGRNGDFNVGRLTTEIGEFNVKEGIEEYAPGQYAGQFSISRIYPAAYAVGGRYNVEVRATITSIALTDMDTRPESEEPPASEPEPDDAQAEVPSEDAALFGDNWPLGDIVRLDPTVDRPVLRRQAARLKALGYHFQPLGRLWKLDA
ncbi:MAG: DUF3275 family protein [Gammaproteobacteria bacterium]|nr:DUF3275 family protein [Gammaproteobacteria bacterium]MCP5318146.1 DUF3275 family protein [Chromatiaceae bacterium]MCW5586690.1 DUF3275 family protein [Chromatiales bacterium]MCP5319150.1 DUF3275 family protein [Chromatiaceae bacterium]MCP5436449.1 DUF3275 family protein [Chromatiaceae bacterium]